MTPPPNLILEFSGWCMIRQPTDPDPYDERRGVRGYTFAFGDEPDLNRVIYFHESPASPPRSHGPPIGVWVTSATKTTPNGPQPIEALANAKFDLMSDPMLENRNWTLTLPGYEPIVPFDVGITSQSSGSDGRPLVSIRRAIPLDPKHPKLDAWQVSEDVLTTKGATGMAFEPQTVGTATGIWDFFQAAVDRRAALRTDLEALERLNPHSPMVAQLRGRIAQLDFAIANPNDRRIGIRQIIERFGFDMLGGNATIHDPTNALGGSLQATAEADWRVDFWMGGWDCDALACYVQGALQIPYSSAA